MMTLAERMRWISRTHGVTLSRAAITTLGFALGFLAQDLVRLFSQQDLQATSIRAIEDAIEPGRVATEAPAAGVLAANLAVTGLPVLD